MCALHSADLLGAAHARRRLREGSRSLDKMKAIIEANGSRPVPAWLDMDKANYTAKVVALAKREDIDLPIEETLIVELYSK